MKRNRSIQDAILAQCCNYGVFIRGSLLWQEKRISNIQIFEEEEEGDVEMAARVEGSHGNTYRTAVGYESAENDFYYYSCDCRAFEEYDGMCKHCVALALALEEYLETGTVGSLGHGEYGGSVETDYHLKEMIHRASFEKRRKNQEAAGEIELIPKLYDKGRNYNGDLMWYLTFRVGNSKKYVVKNLEEFYEAVKEENTISYGKQLSFLHSKSMFTPKAWRYVELIGKILKEDDWRYKTVKRELRLPEHILPEFLNMNMGEEIEYEGLSGEGTLHVAEKNPNIRIHLERLNHADGYQITIPKLDVIVPEDRFIRIKNTIYHCTPEFTETLQPLLNLADPNRERKLLLAESDMTAFYTAIASDLEKHHLLDKGDLDLTEYMPKPAEIFYRLDTQHGLVTLNITGKYGEKEYNLLDISEGEDSRDILKERAALAAAESYFPEKDGKDGVLYFHESDDAAMYRLLSTGIAQMEQEGEVYATDSFKGRKIIHYPHTQVGVSLKSGLLELIIQSEELSGEDYAGILDSYKKKKKYYKLSSGSFLGLEEGAGAVLGELMEGLMLKKTDVMQDTILVPKYRAAYIDQILRNNDGTIQAERSKDYKAVIRDLKDVEDSDYAVPNTLYGELRTYQKNGYRWMCTLAKLGFGGILADDMGLGKTIQTIALLLERKQEGVEAPSLIICPASLVYNWEKELKRFAPKLRVRMIVGNSEERGEQIRSEEESDVWVTSYDMVKRDIAWYKEQAFDVEIIDEAQNIKNQGTQAAKAVKRIKSAVRFALTGTPIENKLSELWSIFDYLMPGILGSYETFKKTYEIPIAYEQDDACSKRLQKMIAPFILRRMKQDVLKELPDKLEENVYVQMEEEQETIYRAHVEQMRSRLIQQSGDEVKTGKLQILAELTRLRQICCDPGLIYENYRRFSGKQKRCMELVREAVENGHKILIFSQFKSVFPILKKWMDQEKIDSYVLTGETSKEERSRMAESFNHDQVPVFLISLKAGGTGLNLTGASIVIHFDPWWNLAAQNQATDRAHRIGQTEQVVVYKLIAKGTIEEKILELQEKKGKLAGEILTGEGISASELTKEDFLEILK